MDIGIYSARSLDIPFFTMITIQYRVVNLFFVERNKSRNAHAKRTKGILFYIRIVENLINNVESIICFLHMSLIRTSLYLV